MVSPRAFVSVFSLGLLALTGVARAAEPVRFAVVNLSPHDLPASVVDEAEREYARLRPGTAVIGDPVMRRLLATGETPDKALPRLVEEARAHRSRGDCAEAIPLARQAEDLALSSVSVDDARDPLKQIYVLLVACEDNLGRTTPRDQAARHLRALVATTPEDLPVSLWDAYVANAVAEPGTAEVQVDSEPANAQVILNFHAQGVTPRTLKMPEGEVLIELQKDGYKKAFRKLAAHERPPRVAFRLADVHRDRVELAAGALRMLEQESALEQRQRTLAQMAQWARAETLVLLRAEANRIVIRFFDAERGAIAQETIISPFDSETGRIEVLAKRQTPGRPAGGRPGILAPISPDGRATAQGGLGPPAAAPDASTGLDESYKAPPMPRGRPDRGTGPWWGWLIAAVVAGGIAAVVISDRPRRADTINVNASF